jgi:hypothetical protein
VQSVPLQTPNSPNSILGFLGNSASPDSSRNFIETVYPTLIGRPSALRFAQGFDANGEQNGHPYGDLVKLADITIMGRGDLDASDILIA